MGKTIKLNDDTFIDASGVKDSFLDKDQNTINNMIRQLEYDANFDVNATKFVTYDVQRRALHFMGIFWTPFSWGNYALIGINHNTSNSKCIIYDITDASIITANDDGKWFRATIPSSHIVFVSAFIALN